MWVAACPIYGMLLQEDIAGEYWRFYIQACTTDGVLEGLQPLIVMSGIWGMLHMRRQNFWIYFY